MFSENEKKLAYGLAVVLLAVGIICYSYTAFSEAPPNPPHRMMFKVVTGDVLFQHKTHAAPEQYALSCADCHHHPEGEESDFRACSDCHAKSVDPDALASVAKTCAECHDPEDYDLQEMTPKADALHKQCIGCHKQFEAGPAECASCHMS